MPQRSMDAAVIVLTAVLLLSPVRSILADGNGNTEPSSSSRQGDDGGQTSGFTLSGLDGTNNTSPDSSSNNGEQPPRNSSSSTQNDTSEASALASDVYVHESQWPALSQLASALKSQLDVSSWTLASGGTVTCSQMLGMSCDASGMIIALDLTNQGISGTIPDVISNLTHLQTLSLGGNLFTGNIPRSFSALVKLEVLDLERNRLSGPPTDIFRSLQSLHFLSLADNHFTGSIPVGILDCTSLAYLDLSKNVFTRAIPSTIGFLGNLTTLFLQKNALRGNIPASLGFLTNLQTLDLSSNLLFGRVPAWLLQLPNLTTLILSSNQLSGPLPSGFISAGLISGQLSVGQNYFTGDASVDAAGQVFCPSGQLLQPPAPANDSSISDSANKSSDAVAAADGDNGGVGGSPDDNGNGHGAANAAAGNGSNMLSSFQSSSSEAAASTASSSAVINPEPGVVAFTNPALLLNCLSYNDTSACGGPLQETQRTAAACVAFCGASLLPEGPCGGNGACFLQASRSYQPACRCYGGYLPDIAVANVGGISVTYPTCSLNSTYHPPPQDVVSGFFQGGLIPRAPGGQSFNKYFRYASIYYVGNSTSPSWKFPRRSQQVDWRAPLWRQTSVLPPVRDQEKCAGCWAFTAADAVSAAYAILTYNTAPELSVQEILDCSTGDCQTGGYPGDAFRFIANPPASLSGALALESDYPFDGMTTGEVCMPMIGSFSVTMVYEAVKFYGWLGLALAAFRGPVVASVAADSDSFRAYSGGYVYNDPACFANGIVNHNVLVVGYNLIAPVPYWIIRNSWGTVWGDEGYMNMAVAAMPDLSGAVPASAGVCGIYASPALYPVVRDPWSPCRNSPCGSGRCKSGRPGRDMTVNVCACPRGFVAVTNVDNTQSCSPKRVCSLFDSNPCGVGACVNDNLGSYSCVCPQGFSASYRTDNTITCLPDAASWNATTYTVTGSSISCYFVQLAFGLPPDLFQQNNPTINCSIPLFDGTILIVDNPDGQPCSVPYTVSAQDTCDSISALFALPNATDLTALNPALNCASLSAGLGICVARGDPYQLPVCSTYHTVMDGETCSSIMAAENPPLAPLQFFSMNPGLMCDNLLPTAAGDGLGGQAVCVSSEPFGARCSFKVYYVRRGDSCSTILVKYFQPTARLRGTSAAALFTRLNGHQCSGLFIGYAICLPYGVNP